MSRYLLGWGTNQDDIGANRMIFPLEIHHRRLEKKKKELIYTTVRTYFRVKKGTRDGWIEYRNE